MSLKDIIEQSGGRIELIDATPSFKERTSMTYDNLNAVMRANDEAGRHWFEADSMEFFKSRLESNLIDGRYFITSEHGPYGPRAFSVRMADEDAHIQTVGDFMAYETLEAAETALEGVRHP